MNQLATHDLSALGARERALAEQQVAPDEHVRFCLVGHKGEALIALDDRVVVVSACRGRAATFEFAEIGAIQVNTGRRKASVEVHTTALGVAKADDFWATDDEADRFKLPNCIRITRSDLDANAPHVDELRSLVGDAMQRSASVADTHEQAWADLAVQLQELSDAHRDELFADASYIDAQLSALTA